jgi:NTP pyrophosphatase (non-canonical NTP hydrolase)
MEHECKCGGVLPPGHSKACDYWAVIENKRNRSMTLDMWLKETDKTAIYPNEFTKDLAGVVYLTLGLAGESGEVADEIKKIIRNDKGIITPERKKKLCLEMGDVMWYWLRLTKELDLDITEIMAENLKKLSQRYEHR